MAGLFFYTINFLKKARQSIKQGDIPGKCNNINRAQDIIQELQYSLKMDVGGEVAKNLMSLYHFMNYHLIRAKISRDGVKNIDDVISMLDKLNEAWREVITRPEIQDIRQVEQPLHPGLSQGIQA